MPYRNKRKQRQKKNGVRQDRERMFAERREQDKGTQLIPFEAVPLIAKALLTKSNRDPNK